MFPGKSCCALHPSFTQRSVLSFRPVMERNNLKKLAPRFAFPVGDGGARQSLPFALIRCLMLALRLFGSVSHLAGQQNNLPLLTFYVAAADAALHVRTRVGIRSSTQPLPHDVCFNSR